MTEDKQPPQLPEGFQFSQSSLQDFVDCPRRFQLRYVLMQPWPGLITESPLDFEQHWRRGRDLHRLAHQHALGIDAETLEGTISDKTLKSWWQTFLHQPPSDLPQAAQSPEVTLTAPLAGYRLLAKVDLLAAEPGQRLVVVDWKTVHRPLPRTVLAQRLQTRVYRYLAVEAGAAFNSGQQPQPEQVEMLYWFAQREGTTERFPYDTHQHAADREYLEDLIKEITAQTDATWQLTQQQRHCRFCNYRSLCERGVTAGRFQDLDHDLELPEPEIDLEQIAEVEF